MEIDEELSENGVDGGDAAKAPAFVDAITCLCEQGQRLNVLGINFPPRG